MRNHGSSPLRWMSISSLLGALILLTFQLIHFDRLRANFPNGTVIAGIPVGGLDRQASVARLVEVYENPAPGTLKLLEEMIEKSGNDPADWVMERVMDQKIAPTLVTRDLIALGLENTFLAGYFYSGAPLLAIYQTAANQRTDVFTDPDLYNQTTPSDLGMLLEDLYQCSQSGGGTFMAVFRGEITQAECRTMITYLARNRLAALVEAGVPEGTRVAHKHGWVSLSGILHTLGDASIVSTPGGDYILVIFLYQPTQLVWDPASRLVADLSRVIYTYYNLPGQ